MEEILKNISVYDLEKLKVLLSIMPGQETKEVVTLRVFIDEYKNLIQHNRSAAYLRSVIVALNYLVEYFSLENHRPGLQKSISSVELKDVENFLIHLRQKVSKGYVVYFRNLKAAFNKAKEWGYVKENYFTKVKLPKRQKLAPMFINSDQLSVICERLESETIKHFVMIAFHTGMRLDEIVNLRWKNVDLQNRVITVGDENFTTKGRKQRFIPMSEEVFELLVRRDKECVKETPYFVLPPDSRSGQALKKGGEISSYVFCKESGTKFTGNYFSRRFKKACKAAGLDNTIHFHSLRHSFASNLAQKGISLYTIKELLGHSSISTTEIYSHLNMDSLREAVKKLDETPSCAASFRPHPDPLLSKEREDGLKIFRINSGEKR